MEKRREFNLPTYILFLDYEKAYDNVNRNKFWEILQKKDIPLKLYEAIQSLYRRTGTKTRIKDYREIYRNQLKQINVAKIKFPWPLTDYSHI